MYFNGAINNEAEIINGAMKIISGMDWLNLEIHYPKKIIGFNGRINFDKYKPEGPKRKLLDTKKINELGWGHKTSFSDGIKETYKWYKLSIV